MSIHSTERPCKAPRVHTFSPPRHHAAKPRASMEHCERPNLSRLARWLTAKNPTKCWPLLNLIFNVFFCWDALKYLCERSIVIFGALIPPDISQAYMLYPQ